MKIKRSDILLTAAVLAAALLLFLVFRPSDKAGGSVKISVNGKVTAVYDLNEDRTVRIDGDKGYNVISISGGSVCVSEASCPDKLCVKQGEAKYDGETVICLPNRLVVRVESGNGSGADAVAG